MRNLSCWLPRSKFSLLIFSQVAHSDLGHQVNQAHRDHPEEMELGLNQLTLASTLQNTYRVICVFIKIRFFTVTNKKSSRRKCADVQVVASGSFWLDLLDHLVRQGFLGWLKMDWLKTWPTELFFTCRV